MKFHNCFQKRNHTFLSRHATCHGMRNASWSFYSSYFYRTLKVKTFSFKKDFPDPFEIFWHVMVFTVGFQGKSIGERKKVQFVVWSLTKYHRDDGDAVAGLRDLLRSLKRSSFVDMVISTPRPTKVANCFPHNSANFWVNLHGNPLGATLWCRGTMALQRADVARLRQMD